MLEPLNTSSNPAEGPPPATPQSAPGLRAEHPSFELLRDVEAPEHNSRVRIYRHVQTGATIISVSNQDEVLGFRVAFRTVPEDSSGVFHVLEHLVCGAGSPEYPMRGVYFELQKGTTALSTPAGTYQDHTIYGIATKDLQERDSVARIWLDSTFSPNLNRTDLDIQRGHFDLDETGEITFTGVVYGEMTPRAMEPGRVISRLRQEALLPGTTYVHNAGGDPAQIRTLDLDQIVSAHAKYYAAANSCLVFWGNDDEQARLALAAEKLDRIADGGRAVEIPPAEELPVVDRVFAFPAPPGAPLERSAHTELIWTAPDFRDEYKRVLLYVLSGVLGGGEDSALQKAVRSSGAKFSYSGASSMTAGRDRTFTLTFSNSEVEEREQCRDLAMSALRKLASDGIDSDQVRAVINGISYSNQTNVSGPTRATSCPEQMIYRWVHGEDPVAALTMEVHLARILKEVDAGQRPLENLISEFLVGEREPSLLTYAPDSEMVGRTLENEKATVRGAGVILDEDRVRQHAAEVKRIALEPPPAEVVAKIPRASAERLSRTDSVLACDFLDHEGITILHHEIPGAVGYVDLSFDTSGVDAHLLRYLEPLAMALGRFGTGDETPAEFSRRTALGTGGVRVQRQYQNVPEADLAHHTLTVGGRARLDHQQSLFQIIGDICSDANLNNRDLMREWAQSALRGYGYMLTDTNSLGQRVYTPRILSGHYPTEALQVDLDSSPERRKFLEDLCHAIDNDWEEVSARLRETRDQVISRRGLHVNFAASGEVWDAMQAGLPDLLARIPRGVAPSVQPAMQIAPGRNAFGLERNFYFGEAYDLGREGRQLGGALFVASKLLTDHFLTPQIRDGLKAYGAEAWGAADKGLIVMDAWDTANVRAAIDVMRKGGKFLREAALTEHDVEQAVISLISSRDNPVDVPTQASRNLTNYLEGRDIDHLNRRRAQILDTSLSTIRRIGELLDDAIARQDQSILVMAPEAALRELGDYNLNIRSF